ncbi:MAG: Transcription elongation factor greA (Transcript cleavage factor greA) [Microgenomates bacterium 39_7]|nr:MAG: Transcription elongation factor greA (Transcript cleavage factor greA) [Microgenomates bacterium 39_7]
MPNNNHLNESKNKVQLTKEGFQELQEELTELVEEKLPIVIKRISVARDKGDLSENTEYQNAKEDKEIIDARISEIEEVLKRAEVVSKTRSKTQIGLGSEVEICPKGSSDKRQITLVGEFEGDVDEGKISVVSPIGRALLGKKQGDEIVVQAPMGDITYIVKSVK